MGKAIFRVKGRLEMASQDQEATVIINRENNTFSVRPLRGRREYILPLSSVAEMVVQKIIIAEVQQAKPFRQRLVKRGMLG